MMSITMFAPVFASGGISVYLDNKKVQFDVSPLLVNGRTMVPMRAIFEKLGATVEWENDLKLATAQRGDIIVGITIDDTTMYKNGEPIVLDVPAQLKDGRTLVPLRAISEAFDCDVQWNGDTRTVNIFTKPDYKAIQQDYAFDVLKTFVLVNQTEVISEVPAYTRTSNDLYGSTKYIIDFNAQVDAVTLSMIKKYKDAYMYSFITLHRSNQTYFCTFSFYAPSNKTNTPDFRGTYNIDANSFGNNTYIDFKNVSGDSANINLYQKLARSLNLEMLSYTDFVFNDNEFFKTFNNCSMADFGFDLTNVTPADFVEPADFVASGNTQNNASSNNYQGGSGGGYAINTKITASSFPLYLYADDGTGTFLGEISSNKYDTDSIANEYGNYGSKYQTKSIFNQYGNYGSKYSQYSVFNEYATNPPKILDKNGKVVGYLTANKYIRDAISYEEMMVLLKKFNK